MFDSPDKLLLGLVTGVAFGFLLQKGHASKFRVIVGQMLLKDWTVAKIMLTAIAVGAVGVYALVGWEAASLHIKPFHYGGIFLGALFFGAGMTVFGYCPGTSVAACGEGRRDALVGFFGMLTGAAVYVLAYPWLEALVKGAGGAGKTTLQDVLSLPVWLAVAGAVALIALVLGALEYFERYGLSRPSPAGTKIPPVFGRSGREERQPTRHDG